MSLVSVIMPAYNAESTLQAAVGSILTQTHPDWELLLIVDAKSSDQTLSLAREMAARESRIRLISGLAYGGCVYNRNHGLREARGDFICLLDSDDLWHPQKLERQLAFTIAAQADFTCTGYGWMKWDGTPMPTVILPPSQVTHKDLLKQNHIGCLTVMLSRDRFPDLKFVEFLHEDYILWLQLLRQTPALGIRENLATYRQARHSRSGNKVHAATQRWRILRQFERLSLPKTAFYFSHYAINALFKRAGGK